MKNIENIKKEDYEELQRMSLRLNEIMLSNNLHEITLETKDLTHVNMDENPVVIIMRKFEGTNKENYNYGFFDLKKKVKYKWDYDLFINGIK